MNIQDYPEYHVMQPAHNNVVAGVDHRYLAYTDNNAAYMAGELENNNCLDILHFTSIYFMNINQVNYNSYLLKKYI